MNRVIIMGRLVRDAECNVTKSGTEVYNFTVAVDRRTKKGEEKQTDFIDCTAWSQTGAFVNAHFRRGDGIALEGRMESRKWVDSDGKNRVSWGVTVENVYFPTSKKSGESSGTVSETAVGFANVEDDEDLPF